MIVANLATYPPRTSGLPGVIGALAPQVDVLNVVLNQYQEEPQIPQLPNNVNFIIPNADLKDTGKFFPKVDPDDYVFLVDDDISYPPDYVDRTTKWLKTWSNEKVIVGYHGTVYFPEPAPGFIPIHLKESPSTFDKNNPIHNRRAFTFFRSLDRPVHVHQNGSGVCAMRGRHFPPFEYMSTSQRFVDVRMARWSHERGIRQICLPRGNGWLQPIHYGETIYSNFTLQMPGQVIDEIMTYCRPL